MSYFIYIINFLLIQSIININLYYSLLLIFLLNIFKHLLYNISFNIFLNFLNLFLSHINIYAATCH